MGIEIPQLPTQTTTETDDLFVLHNTAQNRTKGLSYESLKNELQIDLGDAFVDNAELSTSATNTYNNSVVAAEGKIKRFINDATPLASLQNSDMFAVKRSTNVTLPNDSVSFSTISDAVIVNAQPSISTSVAISAASITAAYQSADNALLNTQLPSLTSKVSLSPSDSFPIYDNVGSSTKKIVYSNLKGQLQTEINAVSQSQLTSVLAQIATDINNAKLAVLQQVFPVGSRISRIGANALDNPSTYLGFGVWDQEYGFFYVGYNPYNLLFQTVGGAGGQLTHDHSGSTSDHTLTSNQIPSHSHGYRDRFQLERFNAFPPLPPSYSTGYEDLGAFMGGVSADYDNNTLQYINTQTNSVGGNLPHSHGISSEYNLPPYKVEVCWRRTA